MLRELRRLRTSAVGAGSHALLQDTAQDTTQRFVVVWIGARYIYDLRASPGVRGTVRMRMVCVNPARRVTIGNELRHLLFCALRRAFDVFFLHEG